ncbi:MAG: hypothetical protein ACJ73U_10060, partial [Actinophytocola sp.]
RRLPPRLRRALRGEWLGHPAHPIVVTVPIGAYVSAAVLDLFPGSRAAARRLVGLGLLATPVAVGLGLADYAELNVRQRRVGLVHATANAVASVCFTTSYLSRSRKWGLLGLAAMGAGGALGGHLAYAQGAGVHRWQLPESEALEHRTTIA